MFHESQTTVNHSNHTLWLDAEINQWRKWMFCRREICLFFFKTECWVNEYVGLLSNYWPNRVMKVCQHLSECIFPIDLGRFTIMRHYECISVLGCRILVPCHAVLLTLFFYGVQTLPLLYWQEHKKSRGKLSLWHHQFPANPGIL